jgi:hypothetical protein
MNHENVTADDRLLDELRFRASLDAEARYSLTVGRFFTPVPRPQGVRRRAMQQCFANASRLALSRPDEFRYCEGYAFDVLGGAVHHGWVAPIDGDGAIDVTWDEPALSYFGFAIDAQTLGRAIREIRTAGPFALWLRDASNKDAAPKAGRCTPLVTN